MHTAPTRRKQEAGGWANDFQANLREEGDWVSGSTYWLLPTRMYFLGPMFIGDATPSSRSRKGNLEPLRDEHATYHGLQCTPFWTLRPEPTLSSDVAGLAEAGWEDAAGNAPNSPLRYSS